MSTTMNSSKKAGETNLVVPESTDIRRNTGHGFPTAWVALGYVVCAVAALFAGRIIYEETILTWKNGPQAIGFALLHGAAPAAPLIIIAGLVGLPGWASVDVGLLNLIVSSEIPSPSISLVAYPPSVFDHHDVVNPVRDMGRVNGEGSRSR